MSLGDSTSGAAGGGAAQIADARQLLASTFERELATTRRLLAQYPQDKGELQPHPKLKVARELAWLLVMEQRLCLGAIAGTLDMATAFSPAPANFGEVVTAFDSAADEVVRAIRDSSDEQLRGTTRFFVAPQTMGDIPNIQFLWFILHDHIHHRGQFTVYQRMAGGTVPSIYGPSADEPWR